MKTLCTLALLAGFLSLAPAPSPLAALPVAGAPPDTVPARADDKKADPKAVVVPFELLKSRHMAIQVKVNGKGPYRFIFDTGAPTNLINTKTAKDSGMLGGTGLFGVMGDKVLDKKDDGAGFFGALGARPMKKVEIGGVTIEDMSAIVMNHPTVEAIADVVGPLAGIIGYPFFARYKMTIDYQKKELTLVPNGFEPGDPMVALMNKLFSGKRGEKPPPAVLAPAAVWGFAVDKAEDDDAPGVKVTEVLTGTPAAKGGLKPGDRLLLLDARWTDTLSDTYLAASMVKPGRTVTLVVKRDGKELKLSVTPAKGL